MKNYFVSTAFAVSFMLDDEVTLKELSLYAVLSLQDCIFICRPSTRKLEDQALQKNTTFNQQAQKQMLKSKEHRRADDRLSSASSSLQ